MNVILIVLWWLIWRPGSLAVPPRYNPSAANSEASYCDYFKLLKAKIREYDVDARYIYNMDEKGFAVRVTSKTKRVFSKILY